MSHVSESEVMVLNSFATLYLDNSNILHEYLKGFVRSFICSVSKQFYKMLRA